jgi:hypothetical protein
MIVSCKLPENLVVSMEKVLRTFPRARLQTMPLEDLEKGATFLIWDNGEPEPEMPLSPDGSYGTVACLANYVFKYLDADMRYPEDARKLKSLPEAVKKGMENFLNIPEVSTALRMYQTQRGLCEIYERKKREATLRFEAELRALNENEL